MPTQLPIVLRYTFAAKLLRNIGGVAGGRLDRVPLGTKGRPKKDQYLLNP
jgi:hypothetical protein